MSEQWLTVSQAAQQLGMSERQARRYAAKLDPKDKDTTPDIAPDTEGSDAGHQTGHAEHPRPARRPTLVRVSALKAIWEEATGRETPPFTPEVEIRPLEMSAGHTEQNTPDTHGIEPDTAPGTSAFEAGHATGAMSGAAPAPPADWQERTAECREQIQFLRSTVEQHQRSEAELRAALRKALEATPRQLTIGSGGESEAATPTASTTPENSISAAPMDAPKAPAPTRHTQKHRAVRELLRAFFGIGSRDE